MSGHSPIYLKLNLIKDSVPSEAIHRKPKLNWNRSSQEQKESFAKQLTDYLAEPREPIQCLHCQNSSCCEADHYDELEKSTRYLIQGMVDSAWSNLEATQGTTGDQQSRKFTIPGWNKLVKPYQDEAKFWFSVWLSAGKPLHSHIPGVEHDLYKLMKFSRNNYHYAVRRAQHSLKNTENSKLIAKIGSSNLFNELKMLCKNTKSDVTTVIDDVHGAQNISNHFQSIYENLYNEQDDIEKKVIDDILMKLELDGQKTLETVNLFTEDLVKTAVKML